MYLPAIKTTHEHLSTADTAKVVRKALKSAFPSVKFSVRSSTYSMGSSIYVSYCDGPLSADVEAIVNQYNGKFFDGSIDMAYYASHRLLPDGSATIAHTNGTEGSMGSAQAITTDPPHPGARLVRFSGSTSTSRRFSRRMMAAVTVEVEADFAAGNIIFPYGNGAFTIYNTRDEVYKRLSERVLDPADPKECFG